MNRQTRRRNSSGKKSWSLDDILATIQDSTSDVALDWDPNVRLQWSGMGKPDREDLGAWDCYFDDGVISISRDGVNLQIGMWLYNNKSVHIKKSWYKWIIRAIRRKYLKGIRPISPDVVGY